MNLKTYRADNMAQALATVRRNLGKDAVILNTRSFKKGGFFGVGGKNVVEITASSGLNVLHPEQKKKVFSNRFSDKKPFEPAKHEHNENPLRQELSLVKKMVQELLTENKRQQHPSVPEELFSAYLCLINQEVGQELANDIIDKIKKSLSPEQMRDKQIVRRELAKEIEKLIPAAQGISVNKKGTPKVIALVGPTGVGKTTTIAKLAAHFKLREKKKVGFITIDTYRIAAVDQLRTYANIINIPLKVVLSPEELRDAVISMKNCDLILVDTAGRSQNDEIKLRELKTFLKAAKPDEIHMVLSTTASQKNLLANLKRFSSLKIKHIILTKLDESVGMGMLLNIMPKLDQAISYITTGQNVPDDIEPGCTGKLARMLVDLDNWPEPHSEIPVGGASK